jgi:uncharacterized small protein (DUF1192 family)
VTTSRRHAAWSIGVSPPAARQVRQPAAPRRRVSDECDRRTMMAAFDEDDRPKKKTVHDIGQDLSLLSVEELTDRIALLHDEVARLQTALEKKRASRSAADQFFKR